MSSALVACSPIGTHHLWRNNESRAVIMDGVMIRFTPTQYRLLIPLLNGSPVTDSMLVREALSCDLKLLGRENLDKHIDKIREKLRPSGLNIYRIVDYGYVLLAIPDCSYTLAIALTLFLLNNVPQKSLKTEEEIVLKKMVSFPPLFYAILRYHLSVG